MDNEKKPYFSATKEKVCFFATIYWFTLPVFC